MSISWNLVCLNSLNLPWRSRIIQRAIHAMMEEKSINTRGSINLSVSLNADPIVDQQAMAENA
jgi:hypothetical protein